MLLPPDLFFAGLSWHVPLRPLAVVLAPFCKKRPLWPIEHFLLPLTLSMYFISFLCRQRAWDC